MTSLKSPSLDWTSLAEDLLRYRVTTSQWRAILLEERDTPIVRGRLRQVVAKRVGPGIYELRLTPLKKEADGGE